MMTKKTAHCCVNLFIACSSNSSLQALLRCCCLITAKYFWVYCMNIHYNVFRHASIVTLLLRPHLHGTRQIFIRTNIRADIPCVYTTLSGQVSDHQSVQVFNLLRKCTSAGQVFVPCKRGAHADKY